MLTILYEKKDRPFVDGRGQHVMIEGSRLAVEDHANYALHYTSIGQTYETAARTFREQSLYLSDRDLDLLTDELIKRRRRMRREARARVREEGGTVD